MLGKDFTYGSSKLSDFGMKIYDPENEQQFATREIDKSEITSIRPVPNHYSTHYNDVLILNFFIIKDDGNYPSQSDMRLTANNINTLRAWLESPKTPVLLNVEPLDNTDTTVNYYGLFTEIQPFIVGQECFGLHLTFTCNAPYGFTDEVIGTYTLGTVNTQEEQGSDLLDENGNGIINENGESVGVYVNNSAEQKEYLRPIVTIKSSNKFVSGEYISIQNVTDGNKQMLLYLPTNKTSIIVDCKKKRITDGSGNVLSLSDVGLTLPISDEYNFVSAELYTFYWLGLLYGTNNIKFNCPGGSTVSEIKISARHILKSGGF